MLHSTALATFVLVSIGAILGCMAEPSIADDHGLKRDRGSLSAQNLYERGVQERKDGNYESALRLLSRAAELEPANADIALQMGLVLKALKRLPDAEVQLRRTLKLAPAYVDAEIALARIELSSGRQLAAEARATRLKERHPGNSEVVDLAREITGRETVEPKPMEPKLRLTRFDGAVGYTHLSGGRTPWRDASASVAMAIPQHGVVTALLEHAERFDRIDTYLAVRYDTRLAPGLSAYAAVGSTPDADFKPRLALAFGGAQTLFKSCGVLDALSAMIDAKYASFVTGEVKSLLWGLDAELFAGVLQLTAQHIDLIDEDGAYQNGFALRAQLQPNAAVAIFGGYVKAPDTSEGRTFETRSLFVGLRVALSEEFVATATYARDELENLYDRDGGTLALSYQYGAS